MNKYIIMSILSFILFVSSLTYSINYHINHNTHKVSKHIKTAQTAHNKGNIVKEYFTIQSINSNQYVAVNNRKGTDKEQLLFDQSDMKTPIKLTIGSKVIAYYQAEKGEDTFLYVE